MKFILIFIALVLHSNLKSIEHETIFSFPISSLLDETNNDSFNDHLDSFWGWGDDKKVDTSSPFTAEKIANLEKDLQKSIVGQDFAIKTTVAAFKRYVSGLTFKGPIASLLYVGPTGVGKTELAKELARILLKPENFIHLNMTEFSNPSVYRLIGPPRGYVDHELGGEFTEALKKNPNAVVLLDEIEKAHPNVLKLFLKVFEDGAIQDSKGININCKNVIFILTSNLCAQKILTMHDLGHSNKEILEGIRTDLMERLTSELYNRLQPVIFKGLDATISKNIVSTMLNKLSDNILKSHKLQLSFDDSVIDYISQSGFDYLLGARSYKRMIDQSLVTLISNAFEEGYLKGGESAIISYNAPYFTLSVPSNPKTFQFEWNDDAKQGKSHSPLKLEQLLQLEQRLQQKIFGQPNAIKASVACLLRSAAGIRNPNTPIATLLYIGPSGVGKTQLVKELAKELMGKEQAFLRLDMSEYSENGTISRLIGSPPGFVQHDEGGQLTEALKKYPFSIVLLDEIEKAHPKVMKTFLQIFDEGFVSDAQGTRIDCRQALFFLTTNLGSAEILSQQQAGRSEEDILINIQPIITKHLSPELYNRLEPVLFNGLTPELLEKLIGNMLQDTASEIKERKGIIVTFDKSVIAFLKANGFDYQLGARPLKRLIQRTINTTIATAILEGKLQSGDQIQVICENNCILIKKLN